MSKLIFYTCNFGGYDSIPKIVKPIPNAEYYIFSDNRDLLNSATNSPWNLVYKPIWMGNSKRTSSIYKCDATSTFGKNKTIWIDSNLTPKATFDESLITNLISASDFITGKHQVRTRGVDELKFCTAKGYIDVSVARNYIGIMDGLGWMDRDNWLAHTCFIYRNFENPNVVYASKLWATLCAYGPIRDQVSISVALNETECKFKLIDNFDQWLYYYFEKANHISTKTKSSGYE